MTFLTLLRPPPTFTVGKTTAGSTTSLSSGDKIAVSKATMPQAGKLYKAHAHLWLSAAVSTPVKFEVYAVDGTGEPGALLAESDPITLTGTADQVVDFTFSGTNIITIQNATDIWFGPFWKDPGVDSVTFGRDSTASGRRETSAPTYPTAPNPFGTGAVQTGPIAAWLELTTVGSSGGTPASDNTQFFMVA